MEVKHTLGPWRATSADDPEQGVYAGYRIAKMTGGEIQRDRANARLMAAAPDMLDALKMVLQHGRIDNSEHRMNVVCAAITKAEGRP